MVHYCAPGIVVINKRYFSRDDLAAAPVGVTSFTISVLQALYGAGVLCGVVLYERDESGKEPTLGMEPYLYHEIPVMRVSFNFRMEPKSINLILNEVYTALATRSPIVYYQTDTLLNFHPRGIQYCVTHHGPFASDFIDSFSRPLTELAFAGGPKKIETLERQQGLGVRRLLQDELGTVLAHSNLQQRFLEDRGVSSHRFKHLRPPITIPAQCGEWPIPEDLKNFVLGAELLLFTAVARLDYFKNVELLIEAGIQAMRRGAPVKVLAIGDPANDHSRRNRLLAMIPDEYAKNFFITPRLTKDHLYALFAAVQVNGIFVCTSRYETLGITPLEAACSGVLTLIPDSEKVEAASYIPASCRIAYDSIKLAAKVQLIYRTGVPAWAKMMQDHVRPQVSMDGFREDLLRAWREMSKSESMELPVRSHAYDVLGYVLNVPLNAGFSFYTYLRQTVPI